MEKPKKQYLVVSCTKCARYLLAVSDKKTRSCPYCGKRVSMETAKIVARSENPEEARSALQEMKAREHGGRLAVKG
ncbi:MAG: DUF1922 domain-containing protein [Candidatus Bathyarchaeia archaeon]